MDILIMPYARLWQARRNARRVNVVLRTAHWINENYVRLMWGREPRWGCDACGEVWGKMYKFTRGRERRLCEVCKPIFTRWKTLKQVWQRTLHQLGPGEDEFTWPSSDDDCVSEVSEQTHEWHPYTTLDSGDPHVYSFTTLFDDDAVM